MKNIFLIVVFLVSSVVSAQEKYDVAAVSKFQKTINDEFSNPKETPLTTEAFKDFKGLDFFPANAKFFIIAKFKRTPNEKQFGMKTSTKRLPVYVKYGEITFSLDGKKFKLNVYQSIDLIKQKEFQDNLFLPFSDLTSGKESYIGGRYIDLKIPSGDTMVVDFNQAYNPYCAYNHKYSCPAVPLENDLNIEINAGVKAYHD